jgi:hypothetical protein
MGKKVNSTTQVVQLECWLPQERQGRNLKVLAWTEEKAV